MSEWTEWRGGDCPVKPNDLVQVRFQKSPHEQESIESRNRKARFFQWDHKTVGDGPCWGNIVAYRMAGLDE